MQPSSCHGIEQTDLEPWKLGLPSYLAITQQQKYSAAHMQISQGKSSSKSRNSGTALAHHLGNRSYTDMARPKNSASESFLGGVLPDVQPVWSCSCSVHCTRPQEKRVHTSTCHSSRKNVRRNTVPRLARVPCRPLPMSARKAKSGKEIG